MKDEGTVLQFYHATEGSFVNLFQPTEHHMNAPLISIGLPVYNGEKYLRESLNSILSQSLRDFELIICDNCSTDSTFELCKEFAASDNRIRLYRNDSNIGVSRNHNKTFEFSRGKYFRWAASDDICTPLLLEKCAKILEQYPEVSLCHFWVTRIFEDAPGKQVLIKPVEGIEPSPSERFRSVSDPNHACEHVYGLIRTSLLRKVRLHRNYTDSDRTMLTELSLHGQFYVIQEPLFFKRFHSDNNYRNRSAKMVAFDEAYHGKIVFPYVIQFFDHLRTIRRTSLKLSDKLKCYWIMAGWPIRHRYRLGRELLIALQTLRMRLLGSPQEK